MDLPFDDYDEDYCDIVEHIGDCEDCGLCDCEDEVEFDLDDDERFKFYTDEYKEFLSKYANKIYNTDGCPYCIATVFDEFYEDDFTR